MNPVIQTNGLTKRYGRLTAVDELDLAVEPGEVFGFLGPNGAGKSTTLRMMVGLIRPTAGTVTIFGHNVWRDHCAAVARVGALIEAPAFYKYLSGRDNLRILANTGANHSSKEINRVLETVGLADRADDKVKTYSQGMRQRLGIALAIVGQPDLVLLDEPTNGLDPRGMKEVRDLIKRISSEMGLTVFLSSHLLHEVEQVCTRVAVINRGRVIETGSVSDLIGRPDTYEVRVDLAAKAQEQLKELGWASVSGVSDGGLSITLDGGTPAELNRFLVERGFAVSALVPQRTSLEDVYLELMDDDNG